MLNLIDRNALKWFKRAERKFVVLPTGEELEYVSPSSELKRTEDTSWKDAWVKRVGVEQANKISTAAKKGGTATHSEIETTGEADKLGSWSTKYDLIAQEAFCYHPLDDGRYIAGFADAIVCPKEHKSYGVVDFKTANKPKKEEWIGSYKMQTAIYAPMLHHTYGISFEFAQVVILLPSGEPQIFSLCRQQMRLNHKLFQKRCGIVLGQPE